MLKRSEFFLLPILLTLLTVTSCKKPIELPDGVQVLIDGESIEGDKIITVPRGADVRLQVFGLQPSSAITMTVRKLGIRVYEGEFSADGEGMVDQVISMPDVDARATAIIAFTDHAGTAQEMSFVIDPE